MWPWSRYLSSLRPSFIRGSIYSQRCYEDGIKYRTPSYQQKVDDSHINSPFTSLTNSSSTPSHLNENFGVLWILWVGNNYNYTCGGLVRLLQLHVSKTIPLFNQVILHQVIHPHGNNYLKRKTLCVEFIAAVLQRWKAKNTVLVSDWETDTQITKHSLGGILLSL